MKKLIDMKHFFFNSNINIYQKEAKWERKDINTIRKVLKISNVIKNGLTIKLSNDKDLKFYNYKWKGINKPTNILSFTYCDKKFPFQNNLLSFLLLLLTYPEFEQVI